MKIWITGICGLIGSHVAEALIKEGHEVGGNDALICGDFANSPIKEWNKSHTSTDCTHIQLLNYDLDTFKPDVVFHAAATASEGFSVFSPHFITKNVAEASVATFSAAISAGAKRIVYLSSMARYGQGKPPFVETDPVNPIDPYANSKVYAENQLKTLCGIHGVKWSIGVPHNVIGTRQQITPYRNVITIFLNRLKLDLPVYIYGDGEQKRSFSPIADCLPPLLKMVYGEADGEVINIGPDENEMTINEVLDLCEGVVGKKAQRVYLPPRPLTDNVKHAYCSSEKAKKLLGFEPKQSLRECVQEMSDHMIPKPFNYNFDIEISTDELPITWRERL